MKSSQRCLCINAAVRNHFLRLSARVSFLVICFFSHLKMHIFLWGAWFLWEKSQIDRWNLHIDVFVLRQRWEIISSGFQNEIFCFIRVWKMVYQQFENANFSFRSLILVKKITHVDRRNLHRNVCDEATVRNHFLSERVFRFIRIWKIVYQQFENAH